VTTADEPLAVADWDYVRLLAGLRVLHPGGAVERVWAEVGRECLEMEGRGVPHHACVGYCEMVMRRELREGRS
jgi:hypothetical protein